MVAFEHGPCSFDEAFRTPSLMSVVDERMEDQRFMARRKAEGLPLATADGGGGQYEGRGKVRNAAATSPRYSCIRREGVLFEWPGKSAAGGLRASSAMRHPRAQTSLLRS